VGLEWPIDEVTEISFSDHISLLDADIIVFNPDISDYIHYYGREEYLGKPCLDDSNSFALKEALDHWKREIKEAYEAGKTIIVFLNTVQDVYVATGEKRHSGTGRNQTTTRIVTQINNYKAIPTDLAPVNTNGSAMKLTKEGTIIAAYWQDFGKLSNYRVILKQDIKLPSITTKSGDKPVGSILRGKSGGSLVLLPYFGFHLDEYSAESDEPETGYVWTQEAEQAGKRLLSHIIDIDKALKDSFDRTPMPQWAKDKSYQSSKERELHGELLVVENKIEELSQGKEALITKLHEAGYLRGLLYEKGPALEIAIIESLKILGFKASNYKDSESEFDVVFESQEGRLLGEAEGKDAKAINIDKLRQLEMNIHEDFARDEVSTMAKGVLFGNAYRLTELATRGEYFTEKCLTAAKRSGFALVRTPDLFFASKYVLETQDEAFSAQCRKVIIETIGSAVIFPNAPLSSSKDEEVCST
jgi:hypothetical protein